MKEHRFYIDIAAGLFLFVLAACFSASLLAASLGFDGAGAMPGLMILDAYGFCSVLIPMFLFLTGTICFLRKWTGRLAFRLLTACVPFFTLVATESICRSIYALGEDSFTSAKISIAAALGIMLVIIEYLGAGIIGDKVFSQMGGGKDSKNADSAAKKQYTSGTRSQGSADDGLDDADAQMVLDDAKREQDEINGKASGEHHTPAVPNENAKDKANGGHHTPDASNGSAQSMADANSKPDAKSSDEKNINDSDTLENIDGGAKASVASKTDDALKETDKIDETKNTDADDAHKLKAGDAAEENTARDKAAEESGTVSDGVFQAGGAVITEEEYNALTRTVDEDIADETPQEISWDNMGAAGEKKNNRLMELINRIEMSSGAALSELKAHTMQARDGVKAEPAIESSDKELPSIEIKEHKDDESHKKDAQSGVETALYTDLPDSTACLVQETVTEEDIASNPNPTGAKEKSVLELIRMGVKKQEIDAKDQWLADNYQAAQIDGQLMPANQGLPEKDEKEDYAGANSAENPADECRPQNESANGYGQAMISSGSKESEASSSLDEDFFDIDINDPDLDEDSITDDSITDDSIADDSIEDDSIAKAAFDNESIAENSTAIAGNGGGVADDNEAKADEQGCDTIIREHSLPKQSAADVFAQMDADVRKELGIDTDAALDDVISAPSAALAAAMTGTDDGKNDLEASPAAVTADSCLPQVSSPAVGGGQPSPQRADDAIAMDSGHSLTANAVQDTADDVIRDESVDSAMPAAETSFDVASGTEHTASVSTKDMRTAPSANAPAADFAPAIAPAASAERSELHISRGPYIVPTALLTEYADDEYWVIDAGTQRASATLKETLGEFHIEAEVVGIRKGPVVTMFELLPAPGVKLSKIVALQDNIALRLAASSVRIVAPIPGKKAVGIEIPNKKRSIVGFREIIEQDAAEFKSMAVPVILGKDILGHPKIIDLVKTPHLLIAGATGAGKSVCVNSIILSVLYKRSPQDVKLILIDPKVVELKLYNDIPHLLVPVITETKKALQALQWALCEMERRYAMLDRMGCREIASYNKKIVEKNIAAEKMPYIIIIIDEFADLMATSGKELESTVARLAAMSRAVGIHLALATQRPSIDVITGLIKANIPSRIAFMVASKTDSRIIIDQVGAEKLLGKGDMLYASAVDPYPTRIQGTFVSDQEVENVVDYIKQYDTPDYIEDEVFVSDDDDSVSDPSEFDGDDPLYDEALQVVVQAGKASASYIQRRLKIGYNRAARLVEDMETRGIVGPANGSKPREIVHLP